MSSLTPKPMQRISKERLVYGSGDYLFGHIEKLQGDKPFGSFLDAGTGLHSLRWIATLGAEFDEEGTKNMTDFTAVTADEGMRSNVQKEVDELGISHLGKVVIGNWFPPDNDDKQSLASIDAVDGDGDGDDDDANGETTKLYDTILADYLIGAMAGFPPGHYSQDRMIEKLARRLKPGGRLYIVGLEPIPDEYDPPSAPQNIICKVRQVRDACILLAGDRCYREYPRDWIERQVARLATTRISPTDNADHSDALPRLKHIGSKEFPILYRHHTIVKQINVARSKLSRFPSRGLANEMRKTLDDLEKQSYAATEKIQRGRRVELGFDYVVTAERIVDETDGEEPV
eukprot:CAMPEP_0172360420 /NCGR_PEP_ID=MMETSP1060-20121228/4443_1 /TAXON_ID=37318 /ORGANISM="Pseudo-nitzschia pungens, Strain cf. cingulata" /LENGTH=343 /DNA_ID=CAMNT_0013082403 /DNA_START=215 /DNA_END=1246 /DNA_ORIENTATION=-